MRHLLIAFVALGSSGLAADPAPPVRLLSAEQAKSCTLLGLATDSRVSILHPDDAAQKALMTAEQKAAKAGANAAVISQTSREQNRQTVMLQTYRCDEPAAN